MTSAALCACELEARSLATGPALYEPQSASAGARTALCEPQSADFVGGSIYVCFHVCALICVLSKPLMYNVFSCGFYICLLFAVFFWGCVLSYVCSLIRVVLFMSCVFSCVCVLLCARVLKCKASFFTFVLVCFALFAVSCRDNNSCWMLLVNELFQWCLRIAIRSEIGQLQQVVQERNHAHACEKQHFRAHCFFTGRQKYKTCLGMF